MESAREFPRAARITVVMTKMAPRVCRGAVEAALHIGEGTGYFAAYLSPGIRKIKATVVMPSPP